MVGKETHTQSISAVAVCQDACLYIRVKGLIIAETSDVGQITFGIAEVADEAANLQISYVSVCLPNPSLI
jgi:hypothetical protein